MRSGLWKEAREQSAVWEESWFTSPTVQPQGCDVIQRNKHWIGSTGGPESQSSICLKEVLEICSI